MALNSNQQIKILIHIKVWEPSIPNAKKHVIYSRIQNGDESWMSEIEVEEEMSECCP